MADEFKYWAFVSYSWKDKAWSTWLHRQLDRYRPPRRLIGRVTRDGPIQAKMLPVFRDREDLAGATDLTDSLHSNLRASQYLIVVCSPNSAASAYVNKEVEYFKSLGREDRVFCFIVAGSPGAKDQACCYPPAVREKFDRGGQRTGDEAHPLAPDARPQGDGRWKARTKLIAGLLGVANDELARREWWRTFWQRVRLGSAALAAVAVIGVLGQIVRSSRIEHLTDLGRKELLEGNATAALQSLAEAYSRGGKPTKALQFLVHQAKLAVTGKPAGELRGNVWFASFNPDGTRVVTATSEGSAIVWDTATGKVVQTLTGHQPNKGINLASFSHDGKAVVTACIDGTARIWNVETGSAEGLVLNVKARANASNVFPAFFSSDGNKVVTGCSDEPTAVIWDLTAHPATGKVLRHTGANLAPSGVPNGIHYASFSPDGKLVLTAGLDGFANIWDAATGGLIKSLEHDAALRFATFSPDGTRIVTCGYNGEARLWWQDGRPIRKLAVTPEDNHARRAAFSADGKILVVTSSVGSPSIWSGETGEPLPQRDALNFPEAQMTWCVAISRAGLIAVGGDNGLMIWDTEGHSLRIEGEGHRGIVYGVEFSEDGTRLASSGSDGKAYIWDVRDRSLVRRICPLNDQGSVGTNYLALSGHSGWVTGVYADRTGSLVMTIDSNSTLRGWELAAYAYRKLDPFPMGATPVTDIAFDAAGKFLAVGEGRKSEAVTIWDAAKRTKVASFDFGGEIQNVGFVPGQDRVVVLGLRAAAPTVMMADFGPGKPARLEFFPATTMPAFSPAGDKFVFVNQQRVAEVRRTADGAGVARLGIGVKAAIFCADSNRVLTVCEADKEATIWNADDGHSLLSFGRGRIQYAAVSPDGSRVVTLCEGHQPAVIWDAFSGGRLCELEGAEQNYEISGTFGRPLFAKFSADGALVVTQTFSKSIGIWDARTGKLLKKTADHKGTVTSVALSADGKKLLTGAQDVIAQVTDVSYETDSRDAIAALVSNLGQAQSGMSGTGKGK